METSKLARNDSWKRKKNENHGENFHEHWLVFHWILWRLMGWYTKYKLVQVELTGLTPKQITFILQRFQRCFSFNYHGSQTFPVIIESLQSNVMFLSFFFYKVVLFVCSRIFSRFLTTHNFISWRHVIFCKRQAEKTLWQMEYKPFTFNIESCWKIYREVTMYSTMTT